MPSDSLEIKVSLQKLLIALVVIIVPLNFLGLYLSSESTTSLEQVIGAHFRTIAQADATTALQFVSDRVIDLGAVAMEPAVVDAVVGANQAYERRSAEATEANIAEIDKKWDTSAGDTVVEAMLSSPVSRLLQRRREIDPRFLKIIVADENGVPIAATDKPLHYAPTDNAYWQAVSAQGRGGIYVSEVLYDEDSRADYFRIGFPIFGKGSRRFIGAASALIDVSSLFSRLTQAQVGNSARTILVSEDGTVISAPNVSPSIRLKSDEYAAVRDALGTLQGRQAGYLRASMRGGNRIVGFAETGLKQLSPNLAWFVMVSQDEREALASVRTLGHFAILMVVIGLLMVTLLAAYFFLHRKQQLSDIQTATTEEQSPGPVA
ncbi:MAG: cache domain-containing protein [Terriglobales bacterium]